MNGPVCLVIPPSGFLLDERVFMSLGILRVAAVLEGQGIPVEVMDLSGVSNYLEAIRDHATQHRVAAYGITATTPQLPAAMAIARSVRIAGNARLILGGPHVTLVNTARKHGRERATSAFGELARSFDVLVAGDGEKAIFRALTPDAPKLIDADEPSDAGLFLSPGELDELPFPARHLIDVGSYRYDVEGERALSLIAQLGCPFGCSFCGGRNSPTFRRVRVRSSQSVVREMEHLYATYGVRGFMLYDDELNVNRQVIELMRLIAAKQRELDTTWRLRGFIKAELFTRQQAAAMLDAGFRWLLVGFESGSERILKSINKGATVEDNDRCMQIARDAGFKVKALMSIGHAGESADTIAETRDWLLRVRPDEFDLAIITTYPGTPYYDEAVKDPESGIWVYRHPSTGDALYQLDLDYGMIASYYKGRPGDYRSFVFTPTLSADDLVRERDRVEDVVRSELGIRYNASAPSLFYEHSMGQHGALPPWILKTAAIHS
jgi:radical SAM superfamily enzyme YgiQ (UPF0313 family)